MKRLAVFVGTRPEIIKMAAILKEAPKYFDVHFVHTGQHYDWAMSYSFIKELQLPKPDSYLRAGSGQGQFSRIVGQADTLLRRMLPDVVLVEGDTNSALGAAISARKLRLMVGHVEAGCRSFEPDMQEEINRTLIADCAKLHFAPTRGCVRNLEREGIDSRAIFMTGHPVVRTIREVLQVAKLPRALGRVKLRPRSFAFLTTHREENVDDRSRLEGIIDAISQVDLPTIFPAHPRTLRNLRRFGLKKMIRKSQIVLVTPLSFVQSLSLVRSAFIVFTDSGGIQQEAALLGTPCVTLRERTEWEETVHAGVNFLCPDPDAVISTVSYVRQNYPRILRRLANSRNLFGGSAAASKILQLCRRFV